MNKIPEKYNNIAVIIPAFNEEKSIRALVEKIYQYTDNIIIVDDGSTDNTTVNIVDLPITLIKHEHNQGKAASLLTGFKQAINEDIHACITIDADTQHDPHDIPKFIEAMGKYPEHIIIGARANKHDNAPKARYRANLTADFFISWAAGQRITDSQSGYRLYPKKLIEKCLQRKMDYPNFVFESEVLIYAARARFNSICIPIEGYYPEDARASYFRPIKDTLYIVRMVAWKLLSRGFYLSGLFRALSSSPRKRGSSM